MSNDILVASTAEIDVVALLSDDARQLAVNGLDRPIAGYLIELVDAGLAGDAILTMPYAMAPPAAVWWACICAWHACAGLPGPADDEAFRAVVAWVRAPQSAPAERDSDRSKTPIDYCQRAISIARRAGGDRTTLRGVAKLLGYSAKLSLRQAERTGIEHSAGQYVRFGIDVQAGKVPWNRATSAGGG